MAPSVVQHKFGFGVGTSSTTVTGFTAPTPSTDVAYAIVIGNRAAGTTRNVNSVTGLGATWSATNHDANNSGRIRVWKGVNPSTSANVVFTSSGSHTHQVVVVVIRDLNDHSVVQGTARTFPVGTTTHAGPRMFAGPDQVVVAVALGDSAITFPSASVPATGWTTATHNTQAGYGFRVPTVLEENGLTYTQAASVGGVTALGQVVLGDGGDYASLVAKMLPLGAFRMDEPAGVGTAFLDHGKGGITLSITGTSPTYRIAGALVNDPDTGIGNGYGAASTDPDLYRTVSGWFRYAAPPSSGSSYAVMSMWFNGNGATFAGVDMNPSGELVVTPGPFTVSGSHADGDWHMLTWTYNNTDTKARVYVDGVLVGTGPAVTPFPTSQNRFTIGHGTTGLDECMILNRTLSDTEVADLYDLGVTGPPSVSPPLWWDGDSLEPAELLGWWDGDSIEPVELLGQWDGTAIAPIEPPT